MCTTKLKEDRWAGANEQFVGLDTPLEDSNIHVYYQGTFFVVVTKPFWAIKIGDGCFSNRRGIICWVEDSSKGNCYKY
jgi:hypothetical protein